MKDYEIIMIFLTVIGLLLVAAQVTIALVK